MTIPNLEFTTSQSVLIKNLKPNSLKVGQALTIKDKIIPTRKIKTKAAKKRVNL